MSSDAGGNRQRRRRVPVYVRRFSPGGRRHLDLPVLREASAKLTDAGDQWRQFAAGLCQGDQKQGREVDLGRIAGLLRACRDAEKEVYLLS